jgi:hypothetical protein
MKFGAKRRARAALFARASKTGVVDAERPRDLIRINFRFPVGWYDTNLISGLLARGKVPAAFWRG